MYLNLNKDELMLKVKELETNYNKIGYPEYLINRFWSKINIIETWYEKPNECWEWKLDCDNDGYGKFFNSILGRPTGAHRFSYELFYGQIPNGLVICHECDNPPCINPIHLSAKTQQQNINDAINKNRNVKGSKVGNSKLTEQDIEDIINLKYNSRKTIVKTFGISQIEIDYIFNRQVWAHITNKYTDNELINARNFINSCTKLSVEQVIDIKQRLKNNETQLSIAQLYNVSKGIIGDISRGKNYKHIF